MKHNCARKPGKFRNKITNEVVTAVRWREFNVLVVKDFLEDSDVCDMVIGPGVLTLYTGEGASTLQLMDWIVKSASGVISACDARVFEQICEAVE